MNLQEDAIKNAMRTEKTYWIIIFFLFTRILFPVIKHSIKHRWIFAVLGVVTPVIIHEVLHEIIYDFNHLFAIPVYAVFIPLGIYITIYMRRRDERPVYWAWA